MQPDAYEVTGRYGPIAGETPKLRLASSVSSLDGRTKAARDAKERLTMMIDDLGGAEKLTAAGLQLCERAVMLSAACADMEARHYATRDADLGLYATLVNSLRRLLVTLEELRRPAEARQQLTPQQLHDSVVEFLSARGVSLEPGRVSTAPRPGDGEGGAAGFPSGFPAASPDPACGICGTGDGPGAPPGGGDAADSDVTYPPAPKNSQPIKNGCHEDFVIPHNDAHCAWDSQRGKWLVADNLGNVHCFRRDREDAKAAAEALPRIAEGL